MNPEQAIKFRARLISLGEELVDARVATADDVKPVVLDQSAVGRVSRGDAMQMQQMALDSARRRERRFVGVEQALRRLDEGTYGICVDCSEDIDVRRLDIDLTATRCIKCAENLSK